MTTDPRDHDQAARDDAEPLPARPPASTAPDSAPGTFDPAFTLTTPRHHAAADALRRALDEGYVYAALTGPRGTGKSTVLAAVLATVRGLRVLRVAAPDKVTAALGAEIERVSLDEAAKPETDRHVAIVVDDAHLASADLLDSLARLAAARRVGGRLPQVLLVGQPVLWDRLRADRFRALERRLAIRHELLPATAEDPWASIEQALTPVMAAAALTPPAPTLAPPATQSPPPAAPAPAADRTSPIQAVSSQAAPSGTAPSLADDLLARRADFAATRPPSRWPFVAVALAILVIAGITVSAILKTLPKPSQPPTTPVSASTAPTPAPATLATPEVSNAPAASPSPAPDAQSAPRQSAAPASESPAPEPTPAAQLPIPAPQPPEPAPALTETAPPEPARLSAPVPDASPPPPLTQPTATQPTPTPPAELPAAPSPSAAAPPTPQAAAPTPAAPTPTLAPPTLAPEVAALMIRHGEDRLALGDIAAARSFFERAAIGGSAQAALLAARTYDPAALQPTTASFADAARAADWYRRAAALGDSDAIAHLRQNGEPSR